MEVFLILKEEKDRKSDMIGYLILTLPIVVGEKTIEIQINQHGDKLNDHISPNATENSLKTQLKPYRV